MTEKGVGMKNHTPVAGKRKRRRAGITNLTACVIFVISAFIPGMFTPGTFTPSAYAPPPPAVTVTVNDDGTFTPNEIKIKQGDKVKWVNLTRTDSIVQIGPPNVLPPPQLFPLSDPCGIKDNKRDHAFAASDPNEFTGPSRKGVSGIFVLGPTKPGSVQKTAKETCACASEQQEAVYDACSGASKTPKPCVPPEVASLDGNTYKLCEGEAAPLQILDSTWANPDVTGVTIRINWRDIQIVKPAPVLKPPVLAQPAVIAKPPAVVKPGVLPGPPVVAVRPVIVKPYIDYYWDNLDREMNRAVESGKLFTLDVRAGQDGTPDWIFTDYAGAVGPGPVTKLKFKDWGSEGAPPNKNSCGYDVCLGSPTDPAYRELYVAMLKKLAAHVAEDSRWFQSLASVKISGANLFSSEARLPKRCYDGDGDEFLDTIGTDPCVCNPKIWADAGYTPEGLYEYYRVVENTIYDSFYQRKSMGYQLIQSGFPRVVSRTNFLGDSLKDQLKKLLLKPRGVTSDDLDDTEQTEKILEEGRTGRFVDPFGLGKDDVAGKLFVPQHSGLGRLPNDDIVPDVATGKCSQAVPVDTGTKRAAFSIGIGTSADQKTAGCPNPWAVEEGTLHSQITGFQTNNTEGVGSEVDLASALWNLTLNSNGVFLEIYEERLWEIQHSLGTGQSAKALDEKRTNLGSPYSRNLFDWSEELHEKRRKLIVPANPHLQDPFPDSYTHTFSKVIAAPETYYFINPSKCSKSLDMRRVGKITVTP
ncbi:MAG: hypothetical protein QOG71_493 [Pyrinomonadaceae bacterium]|nr:hypothetical protein [Pyrinomonadaceae bacterium]